MSNRHFEDQDRRLDPGLYAPIFTSNPGHGNRSVKQMVMELMNPPRTNDVYDFSTDTYTLSKTWAIGIIGTEHFDTFYTYGGANKVLMSSDALCSEGPSFGLCPELLAWLMDNRGPNKRRFPARVFEQDLEG